MSSILLDGLDKMGIKYEFRRAKDTYKNGLLKDQIHTILQSSSKIGDKISELVGQEKYQKFLPLNRIPQWWFHLLYLSQVRRLN